MSTCLATVVLAACLSTGGVSVALGGAPVAPDGWLNPEGGWITFSLDTYSPSPEGRTGQYAPVTVTRDTNLAGDALRAALSSWAIRELTPGVVEYGWPEQISTNGVTMTRVDWCSYESSSCQYRIQQGSAGEFWVAATATDPATGQPLIDLAGTPRGTVALPALPVLTLSFTRGDAIVDPGGATARLLLDASATTDGAPGELSFQWIVRRLSDGVEQTGTGPVFEPVLDQDGFYCVQLTVTNTSDGFSQTSSCDTLSNVFQLTGIVRPAPAPGPGTGGGPPAAGGAPSPGAGVVFGTPERRAPSALSGGGDAGAQTPTIVWLWRPEWFQSAIEPELPQTSGRPQLKGAAEIIVSRDAPSGASAAPWLAGLGAFGLIGGGYLVSRFRRVRFADVA
jgi:hypothetical protein